MTEDVEPHLRELIPEREVVKFLTEQKSDLTSGPCIAEATEAESDNVSHRDTGVLFHRARYRERTYPQVVVPVRRRTRVITLAHDTHKHRSFKKTLQIIRRSYFWRHAKGRRNLYQIL